MKRDPAAVFLGVVTPMANEEETAVEFVQRVFDNCSDVPRTQLFVVLDKVSKDRTREILENLAKREARLTVVWAPENRCVVDAYVRGYREAISAGCDWILEMDAGFSHLPEQIPEFLAHIGRGYDCVFGTRFLKAGCYQQAFRRRIVSQGGTWLANALLGTNLSDMTSGFELFSRATMESILRKGIRSRQHFFQSEIRAYCRDLRQAEVPIIYRNPSPRLSSSAILESFGQLARLVWLKHTGDLSLNAPATAKRREAVAGCSAIRRWS